MQHLGLLMTCNEEDCIKEVMDNHVKYFDKILCLDGSSDRTEEIIRSYSQVKYLLKDKDIIDKLPNRKIKDGARQFLLAKAQEMYGCGGWITLLHGDEIWHDNPVDMAERAEKAGVKKVVWYAMNFFLHSSDKTRDLDSIPSVQQRIQWYCPGFLEVRQFKNKRGIYYQLEKHGQVLPEGTGWQTYYYYPVYKHYPYRSVGQVLTKQKQHAGKDFSASYNVITDAGNCFQDKLPGFKVARKFDGSFHEFEINQQGTMCWRWLRSGLFYLPMGIGNPFR